MKVLALDTSNQALSVALLDEESLVAEQLLTIKKNHSISLMPTIDFLVASAGWKPTDIERIVVAKGPGSYTGLRVAVATAKTLAYALKADLVGVSSLYSLAAMVSEVGLVIPLMDARRNNVYAGFYEKGKAVMADGHFSFETVLQRAKEWGQVTFVGEVTPFIEQIQEQLPEAKIQSSWPSAYEIGKYGLGLEPQNIHAFEPDYLKRVEAEENWLKSNTESQTDYIKRV
ncbi:tRNA (adenosine(37)-N6)-threonylcarbamoyltransferase complex dimerization subunit type 1 TsaB [Streptococcus cameli]